MCLSTLASLKDTLNRIFMCKLMQVIYSYYLLRLIIATTDDIISESKGYEFHVLTEAQLKP